MFVNINKEKHSIAKQVSLLALCLSLCVLICQSCAHKVNILGEYNSDYHKLLRQNTQHKKSIGLEKIHYETHAVLWSDALQTAYLEEYSKRYNLNAQQIAQLKSNIDETAQNNISFLVFHYGKNYKASKVKLQNEDSQDMERTWLTSLNINGQKILPKKIEAIEGNANSLSYFYPSMTPWSRNYKVVFDKNTILNTLNNTPFDPATNTYSLNMDGIDGNISFQWSEI